MSARELYHFEFFVNEENDRLWLRKFVLNPCLYNKDIDKSAIPPNTHTKSIISQTFSYKNNSIFASIFRYDCFRIVNILTQIESNNNFIMETSSVAIVADTLSVTCVIVCGNKMQFSFDSYDLFYSLQYHSDLILYSRIVERVSPDKADEGNESNYIEISNKQRFVPLELNIRTMYYWTLRCRSADEVDVDNTSGNQSLEKCI